MSSLESDTDQLNDKQTRLLSKMVHRALIEIRGPGRNGMAEQAADLADAFHNLPVFIFSESFSWSLARHCLEEYQNKYSLPKNRWPFDYLVALDKIERGADDID